MKIWSGDCWVGNKKSNLYKIVGGEKMDEYELYELAIEDIKMLVQNVKEQCEEFAETYDYEKEWVFAEFKRELNKTIKE